MEDNIKEKLISRNNKIIEQVINEINIKCPGTVDFIAIAGSFASGVFYEKSDLDLLIVSNDINAQKIAKCFIYDGVGHDIYVSTWDLLNEMANYDNHFVTKLKKLVFVYVKDDNVMNKYKELQEKLDINMNDTDSINKKVGKYLGNAINIQKSILEDNNFSSCLKKVGLIMNLIETIIYMLNKKYVIGGIKNIPVEINKMDNLPPLFMDKYYRLLDLSSKEEIIDSTKDIINIMIDYFNRNNIDIIYDNINNKEKNKKENIASDSFIGTYEELYSNYYNKLKYAAKTNNKYLSFRTMLDIQGFFDEFNDTYNMPFFGIIDKYNQSDLNSNVIEYEKLLNEWLKLYKELNIEVNIIESLDELYSQKHRITK